MSLIELDGFDRGIVTEDSWVAGVRDTARRLGLHPGDSVYEVGCGAGAFLYDLYGQGYQVGGLDRSATLLGHARQMMPGGRFTRADAADLDTGEQWDAVVAFSVFFYFPDYEYARQVIGRMGRKARKAVAILDVPDLAVRDAAEAHRAELAGGQEAYARRYAGLPHLYFDRAWVAGALEECGLSGVQADDQWFPGYDNGGYRFNVCGFQPHVTG